MLLLYSVVFTCVGCVAFICFETGIFNARNDRLSMIANAYVSALERAGGKKMPSVGVRAVLEVMKQIHEEETLNNS